MGGRRLVALALWCGLAGAGCGDDEFAPPDGEPIDAGATPADADALTPDADTPGPGDASADADVSPPSDPGPADADAAADADGATACDTPTPFAPPGSPTGWKHLDTELLTVTQGAPNHRGQDVVVVAGAPQILIGKFAYGAFDKDLEREDVEVFVQDAPPCGPWVSLGVVETSEDGEHGSEYGIEDDGGRVFFTLAPDDQRPLGRHPVRMLVHGDHSVAAFTLFVVAPGTQAVVFDIDGTLTTDDFELVSELFSDIFNGSYVPEMYPGALEVTRAWDDRGYLLVYLTARPDFLERMTLESLVAYGYPPGVMHLTDTNAQAVPTAGGTGQYKTDYLNALLGPATLDIVAAYGNASTDIQAYGAAGIDEAVTYIIGAHAGEEGTTPLAGYPEHLPVVEAQPPAAPAAPPATFGW